VPAEQRQDGFDVLDARRDRRVLLAAGGLAAAAEVEPREREPSGRQLRAEHQILLALLGGAEPVAGDHAGRRRRVVGEMEHETDTAAGDIDGVALAHAT
jgi:hypothetical protein